MATSHSSETRSEFQTLLHGSGVVSLAKSQLSLTGSDRTRWLNGMVTNNIRDLAQGRGVYAFLLNPQGHILGDLHAYNRGESLAVETDQSQIDKIRATFDRYIIMDDVEMADLSRAVLMIAGPQSGSILNKADFLNLPPDPLQFVDHKWQDTTVTLIRGDNPLVESYELWISADHVDSLHAAIIAGGAAPVSETALELLRIASGVPLYGRDIRERDLPQETEQARALHFNKGCYVGQEIVERIRSRGAVHRKFTGFDIQGNSAAVGTKIQLEGKDVGEITSTASLPLNSGERNIALGYVRREAAMPGKELLAGTCKLSIASLPFADLLETKL